jgi:hypothetical protein
MGFNSAFKRLIQKITFVFTKFLQHLNGKNRPFGQTIWTNHLDRPFGQTILSAGNILVDSMAPL